MTIQTITLAGGCFWCMEAVFNKTRGVISAKPGYSNGGVIKPSYKDVSSGTTGCAEVVQVEFDSLKISLDEILLMFFNLHDPTTQDRQGNDVGSQYRSGVYANNEVQLNNVLTWLGEFAKTYKDGENSGKIVTEFDLLKNYSDAEDYHQNYYYNNREQGYCNFVITPKVEKAKKLFAEYVIKE